LLAGLVLNNDLDNNHDPNTPIENFSFRNDTQFSCQDGVDSIVDLVGERRVGQRVRGHACHNSTTVRFIAMLMALWFGNFPTPRQWRGRIYYSDRQDPSSGSPSTLSRAKYQISAMVTFF
jgi:hypothetical protein